MAWHEDTHISGEGNISSQCSVHVRSEKELRKSKPQPDRMPNAQKKEKSFAIGAASGILRVGELCNRCHNATCIICLLEKRRPTLLDGPGSCADDFVAFELI